MKRTPTVISFAIAATALTFLWQAGAQEQTPAPGAAEATETTEVAPAPSTPDERQLLAEIAEALEAVQTASGRFAQINPDYSVVEGDFAIQRPGRVRFEYDDPSPILLVADGTTVAIEDRDLETFDRVPIGQTPLKLLFGSKIDFDSSVEVLNLATSTEQVLLTVRDATGDTDGELTMVLAPESLQLLGWRVVDASGALTSVQLEDVELNNRLSPRLFRIEDPEDDEDE